jgi:probable HAF family extracellular repeat protein
MMSPISRRTGACAALASATLLGPLMFGGSALASPASAQTPTPNTTPTPPVPGQYTITDLGTLGTGDNSEATAINNAGVVVGNFYYTPFKTHGFRWSNGTMTDLGVEATDSSSFAFDINDAGQVAGTAERTVGGGFGYPARWSASGVLQDLGGTDDRFIGSAGAIDPSGRVVGGQRQVDIYDDSVGFGYIWDQAGKRSPLGDGIRPANDINARGQVVGGLPAYVWQNGKITRVLPGLSNTNVNWGPIAAAINIQGTVAGQTGIGTDAQAAAIWPPGSGPLILGELQGITRNVSSAINAAGQVVGTSDPGCGPCTDTPTTRPWLWQPGGPLVPSPVLMKDLNTLLPAGSGWLLNTATDINDRGQIVGSGMHNGHHRAYLLTPAFTASINFEPSGATVPTGYQADTGAVLGQRAGGYTYGWNIDNSANTRDRNNATSPDQRYDTFIHMQRPSSATTTWEIAVPNGHYLVHLVGGDPGYTDSTYGISVEGTVALTGKPTAAQSWLEATVQVTVTDGRLTVTNATGSSNNKLDYVDLINIP